MVVLLSYQRAFAAVVYGDCYSPCMGNPIGPIDQQNGWKKPFLHGSGASLGKENEIPVDQALGRKRNLSLEDVHHQP